MNQPPAIPTGETPTERTWRDRGASLVEYALLLALIAVMCVSALRVLGGSLDDRYADTANQLGTAGSSTPDE